MLEVMIILALGVGAFILGFGFHLLVFKNQNILN